MLRDRTRHDWRNNCRDSTKEGHSTSGSTVPGIRSTSFSEFPNYGRISRWDRVAHSCGLMEKMIHWPLRVFIERSQTPRFLLSLRRGRILATFPRCSRSMQPVAMIIRAGSILILGLPRRPPFPCSMRREAVFKGCAISSRIRLPFELFIQSHSPANPPPMAFDCLWMAQRMGRASAMFQRCAWMN